MFVMSPIEIIILLTLELLGEHCTRLCTEACPTLGPDVYFFLCHLVWSALAYTLFTTGGDNDDGYFDSDLSKTTISMIVLLNTSNWPEPLISIYELNRKNFLFFFFYCVVVDWGFMNLVLGLVVAFFEQSWVRRKGIQGDVGDGSGESSGWRLYKRLQATLTDAETLETRTRKWHRAE